MFKRDQGTEVTPTEPTFNKTTGVLTVPSKTGVIYKVDDVTATAGNQSAIDPGKTILVTAEPDEGYYFPHNTVASWEFTRNE